MTALDRLLAEAQPDGTFGGLRPAATPVTPRGWCAWCGRQAALNADGALRAHRNTDQTRCSGSGYQPTTILRTYPTTAESAARHRAELLADLRTRKAA
ncbi:hypothetical protein [Streptomyces sp. ISL-94]|uniref:hypothetical protein n=1 Tax=Streptomyces sp. ISL-94 TaxID=2819190 RepID=UPI001BE71660|nr:hypothetical protein [Streptomyces sp. ISL-94]MBT2477606.1 hypothetical protein [Streptomyces sp. ISL-94]